MTYPIRFQSILNGASALLLLLTILFVSPQLIHSDSASVILNAEALLRAGSLVAESWIYLDDLGLNGRNQAAMLATGMFGVSVKAYVLTVLLGAVFCFAAACFLASTLAASRSDAVTAALIILAGPSLIYQDIVLGLMLSIQIGMILCFAACLIKGVFHGQSHGYLLAALAILVLVAASSPKKALAYIALPAMSALALVALLDLRTHLLERRGLRRMLVAIPLLLVATAAGYWAHIELSKGLLVGRSYSEFSITTSTAQLQANAKLALSLFARFAGKGNALFPSASVLITAAALLVMSAAPGVVLWRREKLTSMRGFIYLYAGVGVAAILAYILSYEAIKQYYGVYYLIMPLSVLVCVAAAAASGATGAGRIVLKAALLGLLVLGSLNCTYFLLRFPQDYFGIGINQHSTHAERQALVDWLLQRDIHFGYANYWDANAITVISDSRIRAQSILVRKGIEQVRLHGWLVSKEWMQYRPAAGTAWFIAQPLRLKKLVPFPKGCLPAAEVAMHAGYSIHIYNSPMPSCFVDATGQ